MLKQVLLYLILISLFWHVDVSAADQTNPLKRVKVAIASAHPLATQAGLEIVNKGGNVFDAAVAVSAALAVVDPSGSGLGGGGYWLLHREIDGFETMIDGREKAPLAASKNMYLNKHGQVIPGLSQNGALAAAIPGMPAALVHLSEKYGHLSLADSLAPAIRYAQTGFSVDEKHLKSLKSRSDILKNNPQSAAIFLNNRQLPPLHPYCDNRI